MKLLFISASNILTTFNRPEQNFIIDLDILYWGSNPSPSKRESDPHPLSYIPLVLRLS